VGCRRDWLGICGENGGDPASIAFCESVGLDYVSASPYRVPIAPLAAAQAALRSADREPPRQHMHLPSRSSRDVEREVLARAVNSYLEYRVFLNCNGTTVLD
jgi:phosphoenolpyruvate-protein kinase (PTS system EI component)